MVETIIKISGSIFVTGIGLGLIAGGLMVIIVLVQSIKERFID